MKVRSWVDPDADQSGQEGDNLVHRYSIEDMSSAEFFYLVHALGNAYRAVGGIPILFEDEVDHARTVMTYLALFRLLAEATTSDYLEHQAGTIDADLEQLLREANGG